MDLANNAERVNRELQDLEKGQSVMVSMADHVLDTKKRVEYGVHQILLEVGDLVKTQGVNINSTLSQRFDGISNDIMDNQNGALANLTSKMEQEMNKVKICYLLTDLAAVRICCYYLRCRFGGRST